MERTLGNKERKKQARVRVRKLATAARRMNSEPASVVSDVPTGVLLFVCGGMAHGIAPRVLEDAVRAVLGRDGGDVAAGCTVSVHGGLGDPHALVVIDNATDAVVRDAAQRVAVHWNMRELGGTVQHVVHCPRERAEAFLGTTSPSEAEAGASVSGVQTAADVPGLELHLEFVTEEEERLIMEDIDAREWEHLEKRRVQHYGHRFNYSTTNVDSSVPRDDAVYPRDAPSFMLMLKRFAARGIHVGTQHEGTYEDPRGYVESGSSFEQMTVNDYYKPGGGIPPHADQHSGFLEPIMSLSLLAPIVMEFHNPETDVHRSVVLPPRSLLVLRGEARLLWTHAIRERTVDVIDGQMVRRARRVSLTFRKLRTKPCACPYVMMCDSQTPATTRNKNVGKVRKNRADGAPRVAPADCEDAAEGGAEGVSEQLSRAGAHAHGADMFEVERRHVRDVYNTIAPHFSRTRFKAWPQVREYLEEAESGAWIADVGCGNGKYLSVRPDVTVVGFDISAGLIQICHDRRYPFIGLGSCMRSPLRSGAFDHAICIAVIHHMATPEHRIQCLSELVRVIKPGGTALVTAWAKEQKKFRDATSQDLYVDWKVVAGHDDPDPPQQQRHATDTADPITTPVPVEMDEKGQRVYKRYYHVFVQGELEGLVAHVRGAHVVRTFYDHDNWCVVIGKDV